MFCICARVAIENPPKFKRFKEKDVAVIFETINIRMASMAEVIMRGETVWGFKSPSEKSLCEESVTKEKKLPPEIQKYIMNYVGGKAILLLVKAQNEIGIPPPIPLPQF